MFKRIAVTLVIVFGIALLSVHIEKLILEQKRALSRQQYQRDILEAERARMKAEFERLQSPSRNDDALLEAKSPSQTQQQ